jgi:16S rRNA (uracil1498-N3)-methyltransferase
MEQAWPWSDRRCFTLRSTPLDGAAELALDDAQHLVRVLRARVGDRILGLDGRGRAWPLSVAALERGEIRLQSDGEPYHEPPPGTAGARVRRIEVAVAWPRPQVGEELVDGLVQLGCARVVPLVTERSQDWAREWSAARVARLERISREACKQARRLWPIEIAEPTDLFSWLGDAASTAGRAVVLDPRAPLALAEFAARARAGEGRTLMAVGPEGGWSAKELDALHEVSLPCAAIASYVLRTELAAQIGAALLLQ